MNKIYPENTIYLKNENTHNRLIKIQVYEKTVRICQIKKYFGKCKKEYYPKYFNYKIDIYNDYDIHRILVDYDYYVFI
jgi:hypothetical protein